MRIGAPNIYVVLPCHLAAINLGIMAMFLGAGAQRIIRIKVSHNSLIDKVLLFQGKI
jgi:hypothetical protein